MYFVYAIQSRVKDWIYVGISSDIERRLSEHNHGHNKSTKPYRPYRLIFQEEQADRPSAREREKYLKSTSGKRWLRKNFVIEG